MATEAAPGGLTKPRQVVSVSAKELRLLEEIRKVRIGRAEIFITDGQPDRIDHIKESIKL